MRRSSQRFTPALAPLDVFIDDKFNAQWKAVTKMPKNGVSKLRCATKIMQNLEAEFNRLDTQQQKVFEEKAAILDRIRTKQQAQQLESSYQVLKQPQLSKDHINAAVEVLLARTSEIHEADAFSLFTRQDRINKRLWTQKIEALIEKDAFDRFLAQIDKAADKIIRTLDPKCMHKWLSSVAAFQSKNERDQSGKERSEKGRDRGGDVKVQAPLKQDKKKWKK